MTLIEIAKGQNGYVSASQATAAGIPRRKLTEAVDKGELVQVGRGLYALPETWKDPYLAVQHRFSRGVFSDDTALFLHAMTDRAPFSLTMTFPRTYNATSARESGILCRSCADEVLELGVVELTTQHGNVVRAYDLERTLCDLVRGQRMVDSQVVTPAMQAYVRSPKRDVAKLIEYARKLGVEKKIRNYLEVLL
ncbi:type IV toxin-antitoxin system AbiEi family antitoxin domain-containing protein [uncultured Actinomyces sp.]|uniref:type IV toxin-antitoxin system AbiEi family antitoxin domain-containing protein n=1 Tax=uncultured Actinomyces sp. TaxID=249061 RepID=UPI00262759CA|nr:type IV toxin-antitoxin system AbiEi family antitoxin domain-containing protein [uncultured Actinomyces sp.]